jgi:hypothetical protein
MNDFYYSLENPLDRALLDTWRRSYEADLCGTPWLCFFDKAKSNVPSLLTSDSFSNLHPSVVFAINQLLCNSLFLLTVAQHFKSPPEEFCWANFDITKSFVPKTENRVSTWQWVNKDLLLTERSGVKALDIEGGELLKKYAIDAANLCYNVYTTKFLFGASVSFTNVKYKSKRIQILQLANNRQEGW